LLTLGLLVLVRLGVFIPVPGIDRAAFGDAIQWHAWAAFVGFIDIFVGGGLSALGIFALGILPFINASIIMQLLTAAIPSVWKTCRRMKGKLVGGESLRLPAMLP
jgi:preprotein translocase subunit SecY